MTPLEQATLSSVIWPTSAPVDQQRRLMALHYAKARGIEVECRQMLLAARLDWLNWLTRTQRNWQAKTRNVNKARFHDSIAIREKYVRCCLR